MKFLKGLWHALSFTRTLVLNLLFLFIVIVIISSIVSAPSIKIPDSTAIHIAPSGFLVDQKSYTSPLPLLVGDAENMPDETVVRTVVNVINDAATDKRVTAMVLQLDYLRGGGISKLNEIGQALQNFKAEGKLVLAYADSYTQQQYYLASYADEIYINELGNLFITGYGLYQNYIKDAADKLKVNFHVFRAGEYKDAVEPYIRNSMSEESREHNSRWLNELWGAYTSKIEAARQLPSGAVDNFISAMPEQLPKYEGSSAEYAKAMGLVDETVDRTGLRQQLIDRFGESDNEMGFAAVTMEEYIASQAISVPELADNIGLIVASGTIYDGRQPEGAIGGDSLSELIRQAREDESVKALVIRVDSGGGSAFASEVIREEILAARDQGLPVYISMGSVAASGGYWISTAADEIWAMPSTLTGSIGVWGLYPNFSESLDSIGIHTDGIGTSELADVFRLDRPLSDQAQKVIQSGVDNIYGNFLSIVAEARNESVEDIHSIAQGRVWTGATAKELNLVDNLGTLDDVISSVAITHNLDKKNVKPIQVPLSFREQFLRALMEESSALGESVKNSLLADTLLNNRQMKSLKDELSQTFSHLNDMPTVLAKCLGCYPP